MLKDQCLTSEQLTKEYVAETGHDVAALESQYDVLSDITVQNFNEVCGVLEGLTNLEEILNQMRDKLVQLSNKHDVITANSYDDLAGEYNRIKNQIQLLCQNINGSEPNYTLGSDTNLTIVNNPTYEPIKITLQVGLNQNSVMTVDLTFICLLLEGNDKDSNDTVQQNLDDNDTNYFFTYTGYNSFNILIAPENETEARSYLDLWDEFKVIFDRGLDNFNSLKNKLEALKASIKEAKEAYSFQVEDWKQKKLEEASEKICCLTDQIEIIDIFMGKC